MKKQISDSLHFLVRWTLRGMIGILGASILITLIYGIFPVPATPLMLLRQVQSQPISDVFSFKKKWVPIEKISTELQAAVIAAEDMNFYEHNGFDWNAIEKAYKHNEKSRRVRGASTISQQVAKNVFLWPHRSWVRKGIEVYFTGLIELLWSKKRILEVYLNVIELGNNLYGVEAASQFYFHKQAYDVNSAEAALIAAVLPNPRKMHISKPSQYVRFRQSMIIRRMPSAASAIIQSNE